MKLPIALKVFKSKILTVALLAFGAFIWLNCMPLHPIHMSSASMLLNKETGGLEISMRVFSDDLESATRGDTFPPLNIGLENENPVTDSMLALYLGQSFIIQTDDVQVPVYFLGREQKEEVTWLYLVVPNFEMADDIAVYYGVLMDFHSDQKNTLYYTLKDERKVTLYMNSNRKQWLEVE
ncbi:MAG: DUF6702 family protein [Bacteroidia bacterium]